MTSRPGCRALRRVPGYGCQGLPGRCSGNAQRDDLLGSGRLERHCGWFLAHSAAELGRAEGPVGVRALRVTPCGNRAGGGARFSVTCPAFSRSRTASARAVSPAARLLSPRSRLRGRGPRVRARGHHSDLVQLTRWHGLWGGSRRALPASGPAHTCRCRPAGRDQVASARARWWRGGRRRPGPS